MTIKQKNPHFPAWISFVMIAMVSVHALPLSGAAFLVGDQAELADAINASNTNASSNTIVFSGNIALISALPAIDTGDAALTLVGGGFTLSRDDESETEFRIIQIDGGLVEIENLTISGGVAKITAEETTEAMEVQAFGGGVFVQGGNLTLTGCTLSGNSAQVGGGLAVLGDEEMGECTVTLIDCLVSDNAAGLGGGIAVISGEDMGACTVTLIDCTIRGNSASGEESLPLGGGIVAAGDVEVLVMGCTLSDNSADAGGGLASFVAENVTLMNSTVSGNSALQAGGGIFGLIAEITVMNCTVTGNAAPQGGGICNFFGAMTLVANLISGNEASMGAEIIGLEEESEYGLILADASNVFGHRGLTHAEAFVNFTPGSSDLVCTIDSDTPTALESILNPTLAHNGGRTLTHALVAGSPAIDLVPTGPETDQRGIARPQGARFDAGAYEFVPVDPVAQYKEYWHQGSANTITPRYWLLDPDGILGERPDHALASGSLPRGLSFVGAALTGRFSALGVYSFTVVSRSGMNEVRNHFRFRVIPPALSPLITGMWVDDDYHPVVIVEERGHGKAATTELINLEVAVGNPLSIAFDWDYIKDDIDFRIIRGELPAGMALREQPVNGFPSAAISGTPTETGEFIFVVSVKDWRGRGYQWIRLVVVE